MLTQFILIHHVIHTRFRTYAGALNRNLHLLALKVECREGARWKKEDMFRGQVGERHEIGIVPGTLLWDNTDKL